MFATLNSSPCSTTTIEQPCCSSASAIPTIPTSVPNSPLVESPTTPTMPSNESLVSLTEKLAVSSQQKNQSSSNKNSLPHSTGSLPIPAPTAGHSLLYVASTGSASFSPKLNKTPSSGDPSPMFNLSPSGLQSNNSTQPPISAQQIRKLLKEFSVTAYKPHRSSETPIEDQCISLFSRDYPSYVIITNYNGELSHSYPAKIFLPETDDFLPRLQLPIDGELTGLPRANTYSTTDYFSSQASNSSYASVLSYGTSNSFRATYGRDATGKMDPNIVKDLILKARVARCRTRFPIPVIVYRNRYICRSATLSGAAELVGRSVYNYCTQSDQTAPIQDWPQPVSCDDDLEEAVMIDSPPKIDGLPFDSKASNSSLYDSPGHHKIGRRSQSVDSGNMFSQVRNKDISLLKYFNVKSICDLMLEKKKVKFGMIVTSSEKADKESRYSDFDIFALPYPGCEFFREFRDANYGGEGLIYNWNQSFVDAGLELPTVNKEELKKSLNIDFDNYRKWDVILLTQNYLKLLLKVLRENDTSLLVHCISGWDRTPLFISLLRLTLWADGEIHRSLNAIEITYLTLAYDWYLFGHQLSDRLAKGEEIMFFCFQFLKNIIDDEFSINYLPPLGDVVIPSSLCLQQPSPKPIPLPKQSSFRRRNDSIDSADKNEFVLADDALLLSSSASSGSGPLHPPTLFPCDPITNHELFMSTYFGPNDVPRQEHGPEPGLSSSMCILGDVEDGEDVNVADDCDDDFHPKLKTDSDTMTSTLTEEATEDYFGKTESRPMNIPTNSSRYSSIQQNVCNNPSEQTPKSSLNRNDSWQVVSDAGSIRDNFLINQLSSPDSSNYSPRRDNYLTDSPQFARHHFGSSSAGSNNSASNLFGSRNNHNLKSYLSKQNERKRKLLEVRSIFNAAYTSLNFSQNNGRFTNLVENFVSPFYSSSAAKDSI